MSASRKALANEEFAKLVQTWLAKRCGRDVTIDGWAGRQTITAFRDQVGFRSPHQPIPEYATARLQWPEDTLEALTDFYGPPGDESVLVSVRPVWPMFLAWDLDTRVTRVRVHRRCAESWQAAQVDLLERMGLEWIKRHRLDRFGGTFNDRPMRGSSGSRSRHSWGIADDRDPLRNGLRTPWPGQAAMPVEYIEAFERQGWKCGARHWQRDAMHVQATR